MQYPNFSQPPAPPSQDKSRTASIWQASLSLLGMLGLWLLALNFAVNGLTSISNPQIAHNEITGMFLLAASLAFSGLLLVPSAWFALARLAGHPAAHFPIKIPLNRWIILPGVGICFILLLIAGGIAAQQTPLDWIILPMIHVLVIGIPIAAILYVGTRGLPKGSPQRGWGVFGAGMTLGPGLIFILEIAALLVVILAGLILIAATPDQLEAFTNQAQQLQTSSLNPDDILRLLEPYLKNPGIVALGLLFMSGIVPMVEEALKPIGVWLLVKRHLTPAEGFTAGLISGAGFALVESLGYASSGNQGWLSTTLLRMPTGLIHITACGLTGWGIAQAISRHKLHPLLAGYASAVAIHGLWNGFTLVSVGSVLIYPDQLGTQVVAGLALLGMLLLFGCTFVILIFCNRHLRSQAAHAIMPAHPELGSEPESIPSESESLLHEHNP